MAILLLGILAIAAPAAYAFRAGRLADPARLGLLVVGSAAALLCGVYLYWAGCYVAFPADFLIWSESDFVNDILKWQNGYPIYGPIDDNNSFTYPPGTQLLTYFLASLAGQGDSIHAYRAVQVVFTILAAIFATLACRRIAQIALPARKLAGMNWWTAVWAAVLLLAASNMQTNPYAQFLHNDSLAQLLCAVAFWLMLEYRQNRSPRVLAAMALLPACGLMVKQSVAIWAGLFTIYLAVFDRPRSLTRAMAYAAASFSAMGLVMAGAYLIWGQPFFYWVFKVLGGHPVEPLRSVQHAIDTWIFFALGLIGGAVLLRGKPLAALAGPWLLSMALISAETYTSGVAWMLNHMGPGSLLCTAWFLVALMKLWPPFLTFHRPAPAPHWIASALAAGATLAAFAGMHIIRLPVRVLSQDAQRYVHEIEKEFENSAPDRVLLDLGSWVYRKDRLNQRDRVATIGEQSYTKTADLAATANRFRTQYYSKILVRNLDDPLFWYDSNHQTGFREILREKYQVARTIRAAEPPAIQGEHSESRYLFSEISVLVPRDSAASPSTSNPGGKQ